MPETMLRYENGNGENLTPTTPRSAPIIVPRTKPKPQLVSRRIAPATISGSDTTHTHYYNAVEKHLPNGDLYIGGFLNNSPHGSGKYLWSDGCMYEGDWDNGVATGKGKFSWPSGATYQGQFKSGRMEGAGTFIGADGDSYIGSWCADKKHGFGAKHYCNGDYYEGQWKNNFQEGQGWYVWKNGNEYVGEWRNGVIHGRGVFVWRNGLKYDGNWDNGAPKAPGFFSWSNDVCKNNAHGITQDVKGFFGQKLSELESDHKRSLFVEDDNYKAVPRICIWESDGEAGDITCDIIDAGFAGYRDDREVKRPGQTISKGHKNYDLMLNLQLGIRHSVGKHASIRRSLKTSDFDPKEKFWTRFPPEGSKITPPHQSVEFRWKDYCPVVFRHLRDLFRVDPADYMLAICGNDALRELSSPGKSGSFFYLTQDDRFMIKTLKKSEVKALLKMLPSYYQHVCRYKNSLVTKFYSVHCVKPVGGLKTRFIVMGNMFCSAFQIHRRFDLKGSSHGRITNKPKEEIDETTTLKDLDLDFVFRLQSKWFQQLLKQIDLDCGFLESEGIMDYSLLVGVHFRDDSVPFAMQTCTYDSYKLQGMDRVSPDRKPLMRVGANMPARATRGGNEDSIYEVVLYMGIIDILQDYDISKKLEHAYKSLQVDPASISAVDPKLYSRRFQDFVTRIFIEEDDR